ncbi:MAG: hypothetical protein ACYS99_17720, partial [Planctomycetota bacterium]
ESLYVRTYARSPTGPVPRGPLRLVPTEGAAERLPEEALVIGDALERFAPLLSGGRRTLGEKGLWRSSALTVARLGAKLLAERGADDVHDLAPVYLRASEAEERFGP